MAAKLLAHEGSRVLRFLKTELLGKPAARDWPRSLSFD